MTLPIPTPAALAQRFAAALAQQQFTASDGTIVTLDATAPQTLEQALSILMALGDYETYLYARDVGIELMVTTATENGLLPQHAQIWGVPREGATSAIGNFVVQSSANNSVTLPVGTLFTVDGTAQWAVTTETTIAPNASASVPVQATTSGVTGNLAANTTAQMFSPVAGVRSVVSDQDGIAGGAPIQPVESWRAAIIAEIRQPPGGGTVSDYERWARQAGAAYVNVVRGWLGRGTVGVIVALDGGVAPTPAQVVAIQAYIDARRPVRGNVTVAAAVVVPQELTIALNPNTTANQAAVIKILTSFYLAQGIGPTIYVEGINAQISAVAGNRNTLLMPNADVTFAVNQFPVFGSVNWQASGQTS
ncbi:baseplate J/gp47 family protein [Brytella acorum]|uniref:Baseplate J/gp47 family protein n=1 Tax=Brytella acorum TaxID=2959299 RepID=A0AA35V646_9PROT|nr:baseplate J/gp47 family protein [Brytella acorum]CAI9120456.1 baseplate J/gp47 family protein [Brytella acorum]